jgi:hypothetical protein
VGNPRNVARFAFIAFAATTALFAWGDSAAVLVGARLGQGVTAGLVYTACASWLLDEWPPEQRGSAMGRNLGSLDGRNDRQPNHRNPRGAVRGMHSFHPGDSRVRARRRLHDDHASPRPVCTSGRGTVAQLISAAASWLRRRMASRLGHCVNRSGHRADQLDRTAGAEPTRRRPGLRRRGIHRGRRRRDRALDSDRPGSSTRAGQYASSAQP